MGHRKWDEPHRDALARFVVKLQEQMDQLEVLIRPRLRLEDLGDLPLISAIPVENPVTSPSSR